MHKYVGFILVALCAGASGCSSKAEAQMPTAPARTITADTDVNQLMAGTVSAPSIGSAGVPVQVYFRLLDGPFVLTDMFAATGSQPILYALPAGQDCALAGMAAIYALDGTNGRLVTSASAMGARLVIKAGEELCVSWSNSNTAGPSIVSWSGFKLY